MRILIDAIKSVWSILSSTFSVTVEITTLIYQLHFTILPSYKNKWNSNDEMIALRFVWKLHDDENEEIPRALISKLK